MVPTRPVLRFKHTLVSLNCDGRYGMGLAAVWLVLLLPVAGGVGLRDALRYQRDAVLGGELWRLVTAHLVHLDLSHALLNAVGATLIWALFARELRPWQWCAIALAAATAIDAGFLLWQPQLHWYVGASGVLHGTMAAGTLAQLRRRDPVSLLLALFLVAKLGYEQLVGALPFESPGTVVVSAHAYGAIGGLLMALPFMRTRYNAA
jgi:rhomboid family GlyGly-CTERM serine protease